MPGVAVEFQGFEVGAEGVVEAADNRVVAFPRVFDDVVTHLIDAVVVIAPSADQGVSPSQPIQPVAASRSGEDVVECIARPAVSRQVFLSGAGQRQILDVGAQGPGDGRLHEVGAFPGQFGDDVRQGLDDVGVVARAADQRVAATANQGVVARQSKEKVVPRIATQDIGKRVARGAVGRCPGEREVLDMLAEGIGHRRLHAVDARFVALEHDVLGVVHYVQVIAVPTRHHVSALATIEPVVGRVADQAVAQGVAGGIHGRRSRQRQVLDIVRQRETDGRPRGVGALVTGFGDQIPRLIDDVDVIAFLTRHGVCACPTVDPVGRLASVERIARGGSGEGVGGTHQRLNSGRVPAGAILETELLDRVVVIAWIVAVEKIRDRELIVRVDD